VSAPVKRLQNFCDLLILIDHESRDPIPLEIVDAESETYHIVIVFCLIPGSTFRLLRPTHDSIMLLSILPHKQANTA